jgi:hypothetical protein
MFTITMLPAHVGDSLWIEYGPAGSEPHRILVDCGTSPTWKNSLKARFDALDQARANPLDKVKFELLVVTHVDSDHVGGVLPLLAKMPPAIRFERVWFNAWRHLDPASVQAGDIMGPVEGEILSSQLDTLGIPWNRTFPKPDRAVRVPKPGSKLPTRKLPGGMRLTVVAPTRTELDILKPHWKEIVEAEGLVTGVPTAKLADKARRKGVVLDLLGDPIPDWADHDPEDLDHTEANGSSIAIVAEYDDPDDGRTKSALLTGDAHGPVLAAGVRRLAAERGQDRLAVDLVKLPHHGSLKNVTRDLVRALDARTWLFSSIGKQHGHPHKEAVARVVVDAPKPKHLKFNYRTKVNEIWDNPASKQKHGYDTEYGDGELLVRV